jgi:hypothetical protein
MACGLLSGEPGQRALHAVHKPGAFLDQALALPIGPLGVLFGKRRHAHHAAMAPFPYGFKLGETATHPTLGHRTVIYSWP